jgi:hypothetical protein
VIASGLSLAMLFSQRKNLTPVRSALQIDSMDYDLRSGLWNVLCQVVFTPPGVVPVCAGIPLTGYGLIRNLLLAVWDEHLHLPVDALPHMFNNAYKELRQYFFNCGWYEVYDILEFIAPRLPDLVRVLFVAGCNDVLKRECSGYRFVGTSITQITAEEEIASIEEALGVADPFASIAAHVSRALELLSDRKAPDYRNSIKESISAVEAACRLISGDKKATLDQALKQIKKFGTLHPALEKAFSSLYGYTSDAEGIRHALVEEPNLDAEDAKFMLIACSAFVNYLRNKVASGS